MRVLLQPRRARNSLRGALVFANLGCCASVFAATASPPLPVADRAAIEAVTGRSVFVGELPGNPLTEPERFLGFDAKQRQFDVRDGDHPPASERHAWQRIGTAGVAWRYRVGDAEINFVNRRDDGSYVISGIEDRRENALTRYEPAEPLLLHGMAPGEARRQRMQVRVYDADDGRSVKYSGSLEVLHQYLGAFRIRTPGGLHDTILTKSVFDGEVGPAQIHDVQYRFFESGVGLVATVESRELQATVFYHSTTHIARLLASPGVPGVESCLRAAGQPPASSAGTC